MADEQIIYLSPEEELTNVRERLERLPSKRIVLIIPQQTQLRSLVGWRLLHSRARELGKDILIISSDRQIRSVVKAAGFRVADSLASTPSSSKSRPDSRSGRTNTGGKSTPHLRGTTNRGPTNANSQTVSPVPPVSPVSPQPGQPSMSMPPVQPLQDYPSISDIPTVDYELETNKPRNSEPTTRGSTAPTSPASPTSSSTFETRNRQFGPNYDFRVGEVPPIYPLTPGDEEEEPDLWIEDVGHAQSLRDAAQQDADSINRPLPREDVIRDPLAFLDDIPSSPLPEQRGAVRFDDLDEAMPDISDYPTGVMPDSDIEDLGDQGSIVESPRSWTDVMQEDERDTQGPPHVHGIRPRSSRGGAMQSPPPEDFDFEDEPPQIYDQPTRVQPPPAATGTGNRTYSVAQNEPRPVALPQNRPTQSPPSSRTGQQKQQKPTPTSSRQPMKTGAGRTGAAQSNRKKAAPKRKASEIGVSIAIGILIFLLIGAIVYFVPTADVTVGVPFSSYPMNMTLIANAASSRNATPGTIDAQTLTYNASTSGKGSATGTAAVGNAQATGSVNFTNKSSQSIEIPTGTILATASGITFVTTLDVQLPPANSTYIPPVSIQAQSQGTIGNVAAHTIVNITPDGQQRILQFNPGLTSTSVLTVTNPQPTTGGGVGKATALSTNDVNKLKATLNVVLQAQLQSWLAKQLHVGDNAGKPVVVETVTTTPAVGSVVTGGTFSETLKMQATVLVVRSAALQSAAFAQMNASVSKDKRYPGYTLYQPQQLKITQLKNTPSKDGSSLKLSFTAAGQIIPSVTVDQIRSLLAGKRVSEVQSTLLGSSGIPGIVSASAVVHPDFLPWLPFLSSHITVHIVPAQPATTPPVAHPTPTPKPKKKT